MNYVYVYIVVHTNLMTKIHIFKIISFVSKQPATYVEFVWSKRVFLFKMGVISPQICSAGRGEAGSEDRQQGLAQVGGQKQVLRRRNQATDTVKCTVEQVETRHLCFYGLKTIHIIDDT